MTDHDIKNELEKANKWYEETFIGPFQKFTEDFMQKQSHMVSGYRGILQQLAIVSGAIATFSLMILSTDLTVSRKLLVGGVILLLLNTLVAFCYLFYAQSKDQKMFHYLEDNKLIPVMDMRNAYFNFLKHKNKESFDNFTKVKHDSIKLIEKDHFDYKKAETDPSDKILLILFAVGMISIILSIVFPNISKIC